LNFKAIFAIKRSVIGISALVGATNLFYN